MISTTELPVKCPHCIRGRIGPEDFDVSCPKCGGSGIDAVALKKRFKISRVTLDMLRVIASSTDESGRFWVPKDKAEYANDKFPESRVWVDGSGAASGIRYLTNHEYVQCVQCGPGLEKYARRCLPKGRALLSEILSAL